MSRRHFNVQWRSANSVLNSVWDDVRAAERTVLDRKSLADLAEQSSAHEWVI
jgi:hypothetical protein